MGGVAVMAIRRPTAADDDDDDDDDDVYLSCLQRCTTALRRFFTKYARTWCGVVVVVVSGDRALRIEGVILVLEKV